METRITKVMTTNPAGHTVSKFYENLTAYQIADRYMEFYDDVEIIHEETTTPHCWFIRCHKNTEGHTPELYQIKWNNL